MKVRSMNTNLPQCRLMVDLPGSPNFHLPAKGYFFVPGVVHPKTGNLLTT